IVPGVVQLRTRAVDVPVAVVRDREQLAPAETVAPDAGLRVDGPRLRAPLVDGRALRAAVHALRGQAQEVEEGGGKVDLRDRARDVRPPAGAARQAQDQGDPNRLAVEEEAVLLLAMVSQPFAVVRGDGEDDRSEEHTSELQSRSDLVCR